MADEGRKPWKDSAQPELLEKIMHRDNLNRAYKRVKANKGAPGIAMRCGLISQNILTL